MHTEFVVNVPEGAILEEKDRTKTSTTILKVARNTGVDSYTAMERMACNSCSWKAANQSKD